MVGVEGDTIVTGLTLLGSIATVIGVAYQLKNKSNFNSKNHLRSVLMFHSTVFTRYGRIVWEIEREFEGGGFGIFLAKWLILSGVLLFTIGFLELDVTVKTGFMVSIVLSAIIAPSISRSFRSAFRNVSFPVLALIFFLFVPLFGNNPEQNSTAVTLGAIFAYLLEILVVLGFSRVPLIVEGRWISALKEDTIKSSVFGVLLTFSISGMLTILWVWSLPSSLNYLVLIGVIGMVILAYIVSDVKNVAVRLFWKVKLPEFSDKLPHLLVKTKTGNIFFGQLYDPLDDKLLILRKTKLVIHGGREVGETLERIASSSVDAKDGAKEPANYISIPWDEIEALQIIEEGLYKTPEMPTENKSSDVKKEKGASKRPEQGTPANELNREQEDNSKKG